MAKKWTDEEIQFLKFAYPNEGFTTKDISTALSRSCKSVHVKAMRLGLKKYKEVLDDDLKRCSKCKVIYKKEFFNKSDNGRLHSWCKNCLRERWRKKYNGNTIIESNGVESNGVESNSVESNGVESKKCLKCKNVKPVNEFPRRLSRKDGLDSYCKECNKIAKEKSKLKLLKERGW